MREIKFRAWNIKECRMYKVQKILLGAAGEGAFQVDGISFAPIQDYFQPNKICTMNWCPENDCGQEDAEHCELMQFTGLLDKNGTEIYEGDIMQFYDKVNEKNVALPVIFDDGQWLMDDGNWKLYLYENKKIVEIIGNIYENTELLK